MLSIYSRKGGLGARVPQTFGRQYHLQTRDSTFHNPSSPLVGIFKLLGIAADAESVASSYEKCREIA